MDVSYIVLVFLILEKEKIFFQLQVNIFDIDRSLFFFKNLIVSLNL